MIAAPVSNACAKDGESGGGSGSGGNSGSGSDDNDSDDHSGSGNSGDDDDNEDDDSPSGSNSGPGSGGGEDNKKRRRRRNEQDRVRNAVSKGDAVALTDLKKFLAQNFPGKILQVNLKRRFGSLVYLVRILAPGNRITNLTLDAKTLQRRWF